MGSALVIINSFVSLTGVVYIWGWWCGSPCLGPAASSWRLHPAGDIAPAPRGSAGGRAWGQCCALTRSSRWSRPEDTQQMQNTQHSALSPRCRFTANHALLPVGWNISMNHLMFPSDESWQLTLGSIRRRVWGSLQSLGALGLNHWVSGNCVLKEQKNAIQKIKGDKICSYLPSWTGSNDKINVWMQIELANHRSLNKLPQL